MFAEISVDNLEQTSAVLSHRLWPNSDAILDSCCAAWNALLDEAGRIRSLCSLDWATPVRT